MKTTWLTGSALLLASALCHGADLGVVTVLDGDARVLRGASWYKLSEGARLQDGDVIAAADRAQVQIEMPLGPTLSFVGPAELFAVSSGLREGKQFTPAEMYLSRGWLKLAVKAGGGALRVRSPAGTITTSDAVAVMHAGPETLEAFVERGSTKLIEPARSGGDGAAHDVKGGDFAIRASDRPFASAGAAPQGFVSAMPRSFRDPLPSRAQLYQVAHVQLVAERPITYAEAEPWLTGPYRHVFIKRLQPRLSDPEFRAAATARAQLYPEWRGMLVPTESAPAEKVEPPAKTEKSDSGWNWPFGSSKK